MGPSVGAYALARRATEDLECGRSSVAPAVGALAAPKSSRVEALGFENPRVLRRRERHPAACGTGGPERFGRKQDGADG